jgi:hypothetical protein
MDKVNKKEAFKGFGRQELFKEELLKCAIDNDSPLSNIDKLKKKSIIIFGRQPEHIDPLMDIVFDDIQKIENNLIWKTKIIGKSDINISKLIQHLNIDDWVNQGRNYLQSKTCLLGSLILFSNKPLLVLYLLSRAINIFENDSIFILIFRLLSTFLLISSNLFIKLSNDD